MFFSMKYGKLYFLLLTCCLQVMQAESLTTENMTFNTDDATKSPTSRPLIEMNVFRIIVVTSLVLLVLMTLIIMCQNCNRKSESATEMCEQDPTYEDLPNVVMSSSLNRNDPPQERQSRERYSLTSLLAENAQVDPMTLHRMELHRIRNHSPYRQDEMKSELQSEMRTCNSSNSSKSRTLPWNSSPQRVSNNTNCTYFVASNSLRRPQHDQFPCCSYNDDHRKAQWQPGLPRTRISVLNRIRNRISKFSPPQGIMELADNAERGGYSRNDTDRVYTKDSGSRFRSRGRESVSNNSQQECKCNAMNTRGRCNTFDPAYVMEDPPEEEEGDRTSWRSCNDGLAHETIGRRHQEDERSRNRSPVKPLPPMRSPVMKVQSRDGNQGRTQYDDVAAEDDVKNHWGVRLVPVHERCVHKTLPKPPKPRLNKVSQSCEDLVGLGKRKPEFKRTYTLDYEGEMPSAETPSSSVELPLPAPPPPLRLDTLPRKTATLPPPPPLRKETLSHKTTPLPPPPRDFNRQASVPMY